MVVLEVLVSREDNAVPVLDLGVCDLEVLREAPLSLGDFGLLRALRLASHHEKPLAVAPAVATGELVFEGGLEDDGGV